jgi:hypothetical protein
MGKNVWFVNGKVVVKSDLSVVAKAFRLKSCAKPKL